MQSINKRLFLISRGWIRAAGIVMIIGFFIVVCPLITPIMMSHRFREPLRIPRVRSCSPEALSWPGEQIFLGPSLMEYDSILAKALILDRILRRNICIARRSRVSNSMVARVPMPSQTVPSGANQICEQKG